jgi:hypothetical protein
LAPSFSLALFVPVFGFACVRGPIVSSWRYFAGPRRRIYASRENAVGAALARSPVGAA